MISKRRTFLLLILLSFALLLAVLSGDPVKQIVLTSILGSFVSSESYSYLILTVILPLVFYTILALALTAAWQKILDRLETRLSATDVNSFRILGRLVIIPFCSLAYLNNFSVFQGTLIGVAALFGTALGFASTNTIGNFLAGLYIMVVRPFSIGDYVIFPNLQIEGIVREVSINYTKVDLKSGNQILLTNNTLLNQSVINTRVDFPTRGQLGEKIVKYRYPLIYGLQFGESHSKFAKAIDETAREFRALLEEAVTWSVVNRSVWERQYQIDITVSNADTLFEITNRFRTAVTERFELLTSK